MVGAGLVLGVDTTKQGHTGEILFAFLFAVLSVPHPRNPKTRLRKVLQSWH